MTVGAFEGRLFDQIRRHIIHTILLLNGQQRSTYLEWFFFITEMRKLVTSEIARILEYFSACLAFIFLSLYFRGCIWFTFLGKRFKFFVINFSTFSISIGQVRFNFFVLLSVISQTLTLFEFFSAYFATESEFVSMFIFMVFQASCWAVGLSTFITL